jgi:hypothetical protein
MGGAQARVFPPEAGHPNVSAMLRSTNKLLLLCAFISSVMLNRNIGSLFGFLRHRRLDHEVSSAHSLAARFNYADDHLSALKAQNKDQIAGLLSFGRTAALKTVDPTLVVSLSSVMRSRTLNDFRFFRLPWLPSAEDHQPHGLLDMPDHCRGFQSTGPPQH